MLRVLVLLGVLIPGLAMAQSQQIVTVQGRVVAVLMDRVQLKADDGSSPIVVLVPGASVNRRVPIQWSDIHPGDWVGVDSKPGADGAQESVAINVFSPKIVAKVRKGQFTMASGDLMTNAPVDKVTSSGDGKALTLKVQDSMVPIRIGPQTTVNRFVDIDASNLKPQRKVLVRGTPNSDGSLQAGSVTLLD